MTSNRSGDNLGRVLKGRRLMVPLTLREMSDLSGVSSSHLGRIERGERFPSAHVLQKIARPLSLGEDELFTLAGYLSPKPSMADDKSPTYTTDRLDPFAAQILAQESAEVQRAVIGILSILKSIARVA